MTKARMSLADAYDCLSDTMGEAARDYLAHEMAGLDYGEGFAELDAEAVPVPHSDRMALSAVLVRKPVVPKFELLPLPGSTKRFACPGCARRFGDRHAALQHWRRMHDDSVFDIAF